jgi:hypothetical protein
MIIGPLQVGRRGRGEIRHDHIGHDGARLGEVDGDESRIHGGLSNLFASSQEFCVDRANLVERFAQLAEIGDQLRGLRISVVRDVVPSGATAGLTDRQISLRTVTRSAHAVAVWTPTAFVGLDQRASQHLLYGRQAVRELVAAFAQCR